MRGVNKVILLGNLGATPEVRYLPDGSSVVNVNLATNESRGQGEERTEHTEWHRLAFFGRNAEVASEYLRKGSQIFVEGTLRTRKWEGKDGQSRWTTEVRVFSFQMLGSRGDAPPPGDDSRRDESGRDEPPPARKADPAPEPAGQPAAAPRDPLDDDDDIPF